MTLCVEDTVPWARHLALRLQRTLSQTNQIRSANARYSALTRKDGARVLRHRTDGVHVIERFTTNHLKFQIEALRWTAWCTFFIFSNICRDYYLNPTFEKAFPRRRLRGWSLSNALMTGLFLLPNCFNSLTINGFGLTVRPI